MRARSSKDNLNPNLSEKMLMSTNDVHQSFRVNSLLHREWFIRVRNVLRILKNEKNGVFRMLPEESIANTLLCNHEKHALPVNGPGRVLRKTYFYRNQWLHQPQLKTRHQRWEGLHAEPITCHPLSHQRLSTTDD